MFQVASGWIDGHFAADHDFMANVSVTTGAPPGPLDIGIDKTNVVKGTGFGSIYGIVLRSLASLSLILITPADVWA
jgi:hypothetical protein